MLSTLLVTLLTSLLPGAQAAPPSKPDILLVVWDATRPDHLTPYGYHRDTTPNLNKLAQQGLVFERAYSSSTWTVPSVAGIFSGSFNLSTTVGFAAEGPNLDLPEVLVTLPELLKAQGYSTGIWTAQNIFTQQKGFLQGFDEHHTPKDTAVDAFHTAALAFLDKPGPTFAIVYYLDPHAPYEPPAAHDLWRDKTQPPVNIRGCPKEPPPRGFPEGSACHSDVNHGTVTFTDAQWQQLRDRYDGELHRNDAWLGALLQGVAARQATSPTAVFFTSDHGEAFNEHADERTWHRIPYETILRVPLIASVPGVKARRVKTAVRTLDLYPTMAALAGAVPGTIDGRSLLELAAADAADRPIFGASHFAGAPITWRDGSYKLIQYRSGPAKVQVFDLAADPGETNDLAPSRPDLVKRLQDGLKAFMDANRRPIEVQARPADETREALRALGYTD